jgi:ribosome modulation factor
MALARSANADKVDPDMAPGNRETSSFVIRAAEWIGDTFGQWQRTRAAAKDDSFVEKWKAAWSDGCEAHKAGKAQSDVPYSRSPRKDAWLAGWLWAERQTSARPSSPTRPEPR